MPKANKKDTSNWVPPTSAFGKQWTGFYMSTDQNSSKHCRRAKCQFCQEERDGKPNQLAKHMIHNCRSISISQKSEYKQLMISEDNAANGVSTLPPSISTPATKEVSIIPDDRIVHDFGIKKFFTPYSLHLIR